MGWWETGNNDDVMGDDPADTVVASLRFHQRMNGTKPSFQELLDLAAVLVRADGADLLADPESVGNGLEAVFEPPAPSLVSNDDPSLERHEKLLFDVAGALHEVSRQYQTLGPARKPRLTELLEALAFPLRVNPERVLRDAEGLRLKEFRVRQ